MQYGTTAMLGDRRFHELLLQFDRDLAAEVRAQGCPACAGVLHTADYARKPRGQPAGLEEAHRLRLSLCCAREGCRQRATPASLRFLGRKVYLGAVVVLISAMRCGPTPVRIRALTALVGVSGRTLSRWRHWWRRVFVDSPFWRVAAAAFMPPVNTADLPASLLQRFAGEGTPPLIALLRFLAPLTAGGGGVRAL